MQGMEGDDGETRGEITRKALHAGSWYPDAPQALESALSRMIAQAQSKLAPSIGRVKAILVPHAGYRFSGPTAAYSYATLMPQLGSNIKRVFILAPSHHVYLASCAISKCTHLATPLGALKTDTEILSSLAASSSARFRDMPINMDEEEHSAEMQYPFLALLLDHVAKTQGTLAAKAITIVPIIVGDLSLEREEEVASVLLPYLKDEESSVFILSSDFCHWGARFNYTRHQGEGISIHQSIENLDRQGMEYVQKLDHSAFQAYLEQTRNTICGRHPISLFLKMAQLWNSRIQQETSSSQIKASFLHYDQSSRVISPKDSSVSYVAAVFYTPTL